jgi:D-alanyl-D-alanine carboxypeptidase
METNFRALALSLLIPSLAFTSTLAGCGDELESPEPDPELSAELQADLQATLDHAVADGSTPGVVLHVSGEGGTWSGAAGLADIDAGIPMASDDRFRAGSMLKTLVAAAVLQEVEEGTLALDDVLTDHLPPAVTAGIQHADSIEVGMLLGHRSGIPEWLTPAIRQTAMTDPGHVWSLDEVLGSVAGQAPMFEPGESFGYSNTNYTLLGEILESVDGRSWREVVREQVIERAGMDDTSLPDPGDVECPACAHGYIPFERSVMLDATNVDPSMAGAGGGHALITTAADLGRLFEQLQTGALFEHADTLDAMLAFQAAVDHGEAGGYLTGYGFGVMQLGIEDEIVIGHLGGTAGYMGFMLYLPTTERYVSGYINVMGDPGAVILPVVQRLAQP